MLRFHRFTVGRLRKDEYGDPEDPEQYRWLRRYSPLRAGAPICLRVDASAGHGRGKPAAKAIAEAADRLAFIECALGMSPFVRGFRALTARTVNLFIRAAVNTGHNVMCAGL